MRKKIYGMINLPSLPGSFGYDGSSVDELTKQAMKEAEALYSAGFDGFIMQNFNDGPVKQKADSATIAAASVVAANIKKSYPTMDLGILLLWDGVGSLDVAVASGADFVRVEHGYTRAEMTCCGIIEACCEELCRRRRFLSVDVPVYADVFEPHSQHILPCSFEASLSETLGYAKADGVFITGKNADESIEMGLKARKMYPNAKLFLGGGATGDNAYQMATIFDAIAVGSWIKCGNLSGPIDPERAKFFIQEVRRAE